MGIINRLSQIKELPTLPRVVLQVQHLVAQNEADAQRLAQVVECDPPLAATVLRLANSALYGAGAHRITSIALALTRIGFNEVRNVAVAMSFVRHFPGSPRMLDHTTFWLHSLAAAYCASALAGKEKGADQAAFLAGLLHDIGIFVYDQFFPEQFAAVTGRAAGGGTTFLQAEQDLPASERHGMVGAALLEIWKLEASIVAAVRFHHDPHKCPGAHQRLAAAVHAAEYVMCNGRIGTFEGSLFDSAQDVLASAGVAPDRVALLLTQAEEQAQRSLGAVFPRGQNDPLPLI